MDEYTLLNQVVEKHPPSTAAPSNNVPIGPTTPPQETSPQVISTNQPTNSQPSTADLATTLNQYPIASNTEISKSENDIDSDKTHESFLVFDLKTSTTTEKYQPKIPLSHPGNHGYNTMLKLIADDLNLEDLDSNNQPSYSVTREQGMTVTTLGIDTSTRTTTIEPLAAQKTLSATTNIQKKKPYKKYGKYCICIIIIKYS